MTTVLDPIKEAEAARKLRESLAAVDDEQLVLDMIEGETGLCEIIDALLIRIQENRGCLEGVGHVIGELEHRRSRYEKRIETDRALIEQALMLAEIDKLERPAATLSLARRAPKIEVSTEADIPAEFWKPAAPQLDKKALLTALKEGRAVPGASLSNCAPSLTVRTN
jgi:hypothetical protein